MFRLFVAATGVAASLAAASAQSAAPDAVAAPGLSVVATLHADGAQIYACQPDAAGKLGWRFREPIATLMRDGKTVGRHYVGPSWALDDGGLLVGKVVASAPGATAADVASLKLDIVSRRGAGLFEGVTTIQRLYVKGGAAAGGCDTEGATLAVPYSADYVFLKP